MTDQKKKLEELVTKLYEDCGVEVQPLFPKVLLRVLPREHKQGAIWLPENKQNKPTIEGVVLRTFKPFMHKVWVRDIDWSKEDWKTDEEATYWEKVESKVKPGDHVLFPHIDYGIVPVWPLDGGVGDYRMVPEDLLIATVHYETQTTKDWLARWLDKNTYEDFTHDLADNMLKDMDVVRKDLASVTTSGA